MIKIVETLFYLNPSILVCIHFASLVMLIAILLIHFAFSIFCLIRLRQGLRHVEWSDEQRRSATPNKAWIPFLRPSPAFLPSRLRMYFRAVFSAPLQLLAIFALHIIVALRIYFSGDAASALRIPTRLLLEWIMRIKVTVVGEREECACIVANHVSSFDIYALLLTTAHSSIGPGLKPVCPGFLAKIETLKMPIIGRVALILGSVFVDRENQGKREAVVSSVEKKLRTWKREDAQLAIFPEGTTTNQGYLLPFKSSTLEFPGVKYQPLHIQYSQPHNSLTFSSTLTHLIFSLCLDSSNLKMTWLPSIPGGPGAAEKMRLAIANHGNFCLTNDGSFRAHRELTKLADRDFT